MVVLWVGGIVTALGAGGIVARRAVQRRAEAAVRDGVAEAEARVVGLLGGTARITFDDEPLQVLLALRDDRIPPGRIVVERATLPNGLDVRRAELSVTEDTGRTAELVAHITPRAVSRQLEVPGLSVVVQRRRLRLVLGMASVAVRVEVVGGRVVLSIPVAPPPLGSMLSAGLTELVPRPPPGVTLRDVTVVDDELEVHATVDLHALEALIDLD